MSHINCFTSQFRRCGWCNSLKESGQYSTCSKCKVVAYCNRDCQAKHWKAVHKSTCKQAVPVTVPSPDYNNNIMDDNHELDVFYKYILLKPVDPNAQLTKKEWQDTVQGITDPDIIKELDNFMQREHEEHEEILCSELVQSSFNWVSCKISVVPGYSSRYNGYNLVGLYDKSYQINSKLGLNINAGFLFMQAGDWYGNTILCCTMNNDDISALSNTGIIEDNLMVENSSSNSNHTISSSNNHTTTDIHNSDNITEEYKNKLTLVAITRNQVLLTIEHHADTSKAYIVPERVRFENISRAAALISFKKENFQVL